MVEIVLKMLKSLKINASEKQINKLIVTHPDYPSLLSIVDAFERLGITYTARRVTKEELNAMSFPYLLPITSVHQQLILIERESDLLRYREQIGNWSGVVLKAEAGYEIDDEEAKKYHSEERASRNLLSTILGALSLVFSVLLIANFSLVHLANLVTAIVGVVFGYLLVAKDLGITYSAVESFCKTGKNSDCDRVLKSEGARLFGLFQFSDATLTYFAFQMVMFALLTVKTISSSIATVLVVVSFLSIPIIFYSLYYQAFVAKAWCKLCLAVDAILVMQFILFLSFSTKEGLRIAETQILVPFASAIIFVLIGSSLLYVKSILTEKRQIELGELEALRIKNNPSVFTYLLSKERIVGISPFHSELKIGAQDAPIKIMMASNLYCNPCKQNHQVLSRLVARYPGKVQATIRFVRSLNEPASCPYILGYWLENIHGTAGEFRKTDRLVHDWFEVMDLGEFRDMYSLSMSEEQRRIGESLAEKHYEWTNEVGISHTPTFFVNGSELPGSYSIKSIMNFIPGLTSVLDEELELNQKMAQTI